MTTTAKSLLKKIRIEPIRDRDDATAIAAGTANLILAQERAALLRDERIEALKMEFNVEIEELEEATRAEPARRAAQRALAQELTTLVHGAAATEAVEAAAQALFGQGDLSSVPADVLDAALREADALKLTTVLAVLPDDSGLGAAVIDRLRRAAHS